MVYVCAMDKMMLETRKQKLFCAPMRPHWAVMTSRVWLNSLGKILRLHLIVNPSRFTQKRFILELLSLCKLDNSRIFNNNRVLIGILNPYFPHSASQGIPPVTVIKPFAEL